jgi:hypothetical protein
MHHPGAGGVLAPPAAPLAVRRSITPHDLLLDSLPHALMIAVMLWTMIGAHSALRCLAGALVMVASAVAYSPGARRSALHWDHIVDLWAMALLLLACLGTGTTASGVHVHLLQLPHPQTTAAVTVLWLGARLALLRLSGWRRARLVGAAVTLAGLVLMGTLG